MAHFEKQKRLNTLPKVGSTSNSKQRRDRRIKQAESVSVRETKAKKGATLHPTSRGAVGETNFTSLSGELRNEIYRLALVTPLTVRLRLRHPVRPHPFFGWTDCREAKPWREPGLLRASKVIRLEASSVYFGLNDFSVTVYPEDMEEVAAWLRSVVSRCGNNPFRQFHFFITALKFRWTDLYSMLPLVHVCAELGLKLTPGTHTQQIGGGIRRSIKGSTPRWTTHVSKPVQFRTLPVPLFVMSHQRKDRLDGAMEEAVELGIRAHNANWHEEWLEWKFDEWFEEKIELRVKRRKRRGVKWNDADLE